MADKKTGKKCKQAIITLWRTLVEKIKHEVVYDGLFLTSVVAMLQIMAASGHRGVRHTSTELGMETLSKLVELLVELDAQHDSKSRQQTGKKKQAGTMHAEMAQDIKDIEEKQDKLKELMESIYQTIFLPRFRDTFLDIRLCCAHGFGRCVVLHKATYFDDQYLKYFGWMCNDTSPLVRAVAIQQLVAIYKSAKDDLEPLENFTGRFVGRFLELAKDVDGRVTTEALKLIHLLLSLDILPDSQQVVEMTLPLMHTGDSALLKALVPLLQHRLQHATDDEVAASQTSAKGKKKGKSKAAGDGTQADAEPTPQQSLLRLAKLLQAEAGDAGGDARDTRLALCSNVVGAMRDEPSLSNWAAYCDLLLNAEDEDEDVHVMLLHLMGAAAASAVAASSAEVEDDTDGTQVTAAPLTGLLPPRPMYTPLTTSQLVRADGHPAEAAAEGQEEHGGGRREQPAAVCPTGQEPPAASLSFWGRPRAAHCRAELVAAAAAPCGAGHAQGAAIRRPPAAARGRLHEAHRCGHAHGLRPGVALATVGDRLEHPSAAPAAPVTDARVLLNRPGSRRTRTRC